MVPIFRIYVLQENGSNISDICSAEKPSPKFPSVPLESHSCVVSVLTVCKKN